MTAAFEAPGPGSWALDRSHFPGGTTPIMEWMITQSMPAAYVRLFEELGVPADRIDCGFVNGFMYTRLRPLIAPDRPSARVPPNFVLRVVTRVHPAFRARTKQAEATLRDRPALGVVRRWDQEIRPRMVSTNRRLQAVEPASLDDDALQAHVSELLDLIRESTELHFWLHGHDLGPIAQYLHACLGWSLEPADALHALAGASPATSAPLHRLVELRGLVDDADVSVWTLDDIRAVSDRARELLDDHLDDHGHVLATGYDLTASTLAEMPDLVVSSVRSAAMPAGTDHEAVAASLRERVPAAERNRFDQLLSDARAVMDMRDDNGPVTFEWPVGLLRRALLAVGDRLVEREVIADRRHVFELSPDEARHVFEDRRPSAVALAERAADRGERSRLSPPELLGDPEAEPPLSVLPDALASLIAATNVAIEHLGMGGSADGDGMCGVGIGTERYVGTARVARSADDAIERLEPGDVLVVRATSPAFNVVLAMAGAVVTADGGPMSHAAVLSRELGLPAVIGVPGALSIPDGSRVEVDAANGTLTVIDTS